MDRSAHCEQCGTVFATRENRGARTRFCSRLCYTNSQRIWRGVIKNCAQCGVKFVQDARDRTYCGQACGRIGASRTRHSKSLRQQACQHCGVEFARRPRSRDAVKYCSRECAFADKTHLARLPKPPKPKPPPPLVACVQCGQEFPKSGVRKLCSDTCRRKRNSVISLRYYNYTPKRDPRPCKRCQVVFVPPQGAVEFCSPRCRRLHTGNAYPKPRYTASVAEIGDRDGWRCHLCRRNVKVKDATRDHIIPQSLGGSHKADNLRLAHRSCNSKRQNRGAAQIALPIDSKVYTRA